MAVVYHLASTSTSPPAPCCTALSCVAPTDVWEALVAALGELGQEALRQGLIKDAEGRDITLTPQTEQELVDYEGMLVSGAVAQRRG